ncbi:hypothetical protein QYZ59_15530 [Clostridium perfringens]|uniref:Tyrosine-type recombinase/integrase n=2 Tax=Clostridium perfringens TaxID=1502 RepID=A0A8H9UXX2_CLOPF|nr:hypothetical protein [Clostridium perfringens]MDU7142718.1 hypothetical protein [Anaerococcus vaginalis]MDU7977620.1 hypothetical protein [Clostridioides difficile]EDT15811.1 hypothetical protein AC3_A0192 [Clostridium perfringens E str. JGS1987]EGT0694011.1 hypothetical protein [Clostridium perfringens]MCX0408686.1 hypothetical protein [Clostridium perfringens]
MENNNYNNLITEFEYAIINALVIDTKRPSNNIDIFKENKVYTESDYRNLMDVSKNLCNFIVENYPNVKNISDINLVHFKSFLEFKALLTNQNTVNQYGIKLLKLRNLIKKTYLLDIYFQYEYNWVNDGNKNNIKNNIPKLTIDEYEKIIKNCTGETLIAIKMIRYLGIKLKEIHDIKVKNIVIKEDNIYILNNDSSILKIIYKPNKETKIFINNLKENYFNSEYIFNIKKDSISKNVNRVLKKLKLYDKFKGIFFTSLLNFHTEMEIENYRKYKED